MMLSLRCPPDCRAVGRTTSKPTDHFPTSSSARRSTMDVHQHHAREFRLESTTAHADVMDAMGGTTPPSSANKWRLLFILNAPALPSEPELKSPAQDEKKRRRMCKVAGCTKYIVQMGRCCRHGGGKKCLVDGCFTGAKHRGLCWNTVAVPNARSMAATRMRRRAVCAGHTAAAPAASTRGARKSRSPKASAGRTAAASAAWSPTASSLRSSARTTSARCTTKSCPGCLGSGLSSSSRLKSMPICTSNSAV